jgi:hypothetical protein
MTEPRRRVARNRSPKVSEIHRRQTDHTKEREKQDSTWIVETAQQRNLKQDGDRAFPGEQTGHRQKSEQTRDRGRFVAYFFRTCPVACLQLKRLFFFVSFLSFGRALFFLR